MAKEAERIMEERDLDRTSVIKLALYYFSIYMQKEKTQSLDLFELVDDIESMAPPDYPRFAEFGE